MKCPNIRLVLHAYTQNPSTQTLHITRLSLAIILSLSFIQPQICSFSFSSPFPESEEHVVEVVPRGLHAAHHVLVEELEEHCKTPNRSIILWRCGNSFGELRWGARAQFQILQGGPSGR